MESTKLSEATGEEKIAEIENLFANDKDALAKYNIVDCILVSELYQKAEILPILINRVKLSGALLEKLNYSFITF